MVNGNTAAVTFSEDFGTEEPTVVETATPTAPRITDWNDRTGTWYAVSDADLRRVLQLSDDITAVTHRDLQVVR